MSLYLTQLNTTLATHLHRFFHIVYIETDVLLIINVI